MVSEMVNSIGHIQSEDAVQSQQSEVVPVAIQRSKSEFVFQFYISNADIRPKLEAVLDQYLRGKLLIGNVTLDNGALYQVGYSLKPTSDLRELPKNQLYDFDPYFVPNVPDCHFLKLDFVYSAQLINTVDDSELNLRQFRKNLGLIYSFTRFALARLESDKPLLRGINDNFLNFSSNVTIDFPRAYSELQKLASKCRKVHDLITVIEDQLLSYPKSDQLCLSFNGGKDCTVLLHALAVIIHHHRNGSLPLLLIKTSEPFAEQDLYVRRVTAFYGCQLSTYESTDLKSALKRVKEERKELVDIFMGVRRSDLPEAVGARLSTVQVTDTDKGWPEFTRIQPLLDWTYSEVWHFIRALSVPYCALYDSGYTSIGDQHNTIPNPALKVAALDPALIKDLNTSPDEDEGSFYLPAHLLGQENTERCSRI